MTSSVEKLKEIIVNGESIEELSIVLAAELESGSVKLVELVEALGELLTNTDKEERVRGIKILSQVLRLLPKGFLSVDECNLLTAFYCDRLNDHYTVIPSTLVGIEALCLMDNLSDASPADILMKMQNNIICQSLTVSHRRTFYSIYNNIFLRKKAKVLADLPGDFLFWLVSGMASEAYPQNLLFLFSFLPSILSEIPPKYIHEEAFTVLESYFPVDYTPVKKDDPITREDLAKGLESCLASSSYFADYCFPLICEKLESTLPVAQLDALSLLIKGIKKWKVEALSTHIEPVWKAIQKVLVPSVDVQVSLTAADALVAILSAYSTEVLSDKDTQAFSYLLDSISSSTHSYLRDPGLSLFVPTLKLLSAVASVSSATSDYIIPRVLPQLVALLESKCSNTNKETILKNLYPILQTSIKFESWKNKACKSHLEKLLPVLIKLIDNSQTCGAAFLCLSAIHSKIDENTRSNILSLVENMCPKETSKYNRDELAKFVTIMSEEYPKEVENCLLQNFSIPDSFDSENTKYIFELLIWISQAEVLTLPVTNLFLRYISVTDNQHHRWRSDAVFILRSYSKEKGYGEALKRLSESEFPETLLRSYLDRCGDTEEETEAAASLLTCLVRSLSSVRQRSLMLNGLKFLNEKINTVESPTFELVLMEGLLAGLQPSIEVPDPLTLFERLLHFSLIANTEQARTSSARLVALFINKSQNDGEVARILEAADSSIKICDKCPASVRLRAWITKALILRGHPPSGTWLEKLLSLTSDDAVGMDAAYGVRLVLEENEVISAENFCSIGFLYKQRVFEKVGLLIPENGKPTRATSLAFAYILKYCPSVLILNNLEKLGAVMVHCLDDGDEVVSTAILEILLMLLKDMVPALARSAEDFIPRFINLASSSPFMTVRKCALDCLYHYAGYKSVDILPYQNTVIHQTRKCLDDKKRLVRQSAVRARTRWFVI